MSADLIGFRFGLLTVMAEGDKSHGYIRMFCRCDCGTERMVRRNMLLGGVSLSCGCRRDRQPKAKSRPPTKVDLTGRVFSRLTVVSDSGERDPQRRLLWACRCECGTLTKVSTTLLLKSITSSCGCLQSELAGARKASKLTGRRFGSLVALRPSDEHDNAGYIRWHVRCDCGTEKTVRSNALVNGETISCGCAKQTGLSRSIEACNRSSVRTARRRALKISAGGTFTEADIRRIYAAQRGCCAWCKEKLGKSFHRDHKTPLARGGSNSADNIELLCKGCNLGKGSKDPIAWANENGRLI